MAARDKTDLGKAARPLTPVEARKSIIKRLEKMARRHRMYQVFSDVVAMIAIEMSCAVDWQSKEVRSKELVRLTERYTAEELQQVPMILAELVLAMEQVPMDFMGDLYMELDLGNAGTGQFFTPWEVCRLMASLTIDLELTRQNIEGKGFFTVHEPAVGAGAMVLAMADHLLTSGINYQKHMHVTAIDVDLTAVHMAYVQFTLLHIPAIIVHGNSLTLQEHSRWHTCAHIIGGWGRKLKYAKEDPRPDRGCGVVALQEPGNSGNVNSESEAT